MDGWKTSFLLGWPIFRCYVSFTRGYIHCTSKCYGWKLWTTDWQVGAELKMVFAYPLQPMPRNMDPFSEFMSWANSAFKAFRSMPGEQHEDPISLGNTKRCTWNNNKKITVSLRYTAISCSLQSLHWTNLMIACCQRSVGMWSQIQVGRQVEMLAACDWRLHATLHDHQKWSMSNPRISSTWISRQHGASIIQPVRRKCKTFPASGASRISNAGLPCRSFSAKASPWSQWLIDKCQATSTRVNLWLWWNMMKSSEPYSEERHLYDKIHDHARVYIRVHRFIQHDLPEMAEIESSPFAVVVFSIFAHKKLHMSSVRNPIVALLSHSQWIGI